mgnify:CR=1 FL=1
MLSASTILKTLVITTREAYLCEVVLRALVLDGARELQSGWTKYYLEQT